MISTSFSSLVPVLKLYWAVKVGRQRKYYSSCKPTLFRYLPVQLAFLTFIVVLLLAKSDWKTRCPYLARISHGFVVVFYWCPCHVLCSWTLCWMLTEVSLFFSVSELTCSLEESLDELQVLKRKNTAHIRVNRFTWNFVTNENRLLLW